MSSPTNRGGFFRSFVYAGRGILRAVREERNFRFHVCFAAYVLAFAPAFSLTRTEWALLLLTVGAMLCAELINSAVERTVDRISAAQHPLSGAAKDFASAAVLALSVFAVGIGIVLFWQPAAWAALFAQWHTAWWQPCLLALSFIPTGLFIFKKK